MGRILHLGSRGDAKHHLLIMSDPRWYGQDSVEQTISDNVKRENFLCKEESIVDDQNATNPGRTDETTEVTRAADDSESSAGRWAKSSIEPIRYDLAPSMTADLALKMKVVTERQKQCDRMLRFSVEPEKEVKSNLTEAKVLGARRAAVRRGFATGFNPHSSEEEQKRQARIARFGLPQSNLYNQPDDDTGARIARARRFGADSIVAATEASVTANHDPKPALEVRRNPAPGEQPRETAIHVFGVDQLSTHDVVKHFTKYGPSWCEWLNDSSCNLAFEDSFTMRRALRGLSVALTPSSTSIQSQDAMVDADGGSNTEEDSPKVPKESDFIHVKQFSSDMDTTDDHSIIDDLAWRPLRPFVRKGRPIALWGRMATEADIRPEKPNPHSKWSRTIRRKIEHGNETGDLRSELSIRRKNFNPGLGIIKDSNSISKTISKKPNKMHIDRALNSS